MNYLLNDKEQFILKGKNKNIVLEQPFLNEEKKVVFGCSNLFWSLPVQFVVNEKERTIEILSLSSFNSSKIKIHLTDENIPFLEKVCQWKQKIIKDLIAYAENLKSGKEVVWAWKTNQEYCPYFFTTPTIIQKGNLSSKYISAFVYAANQKAKELNKACSFESYDDMQKRIAEVFVSLPKGKYKMIKLDYQEMYELSLSEIINLL